MRLDGLTHRDADWAGLRVVVTGLGVSGFAAADALVERGAVVTVLDEGSASGGAGEGRAKILDILGAQVRRGPEHVTAWPADLVDTDLVVTSPGWRPGHPVLAGARRRGIPVWGEVELAWRMRAETGAAPWLTVTGTNGKTTTVQLLEAMLGAAGLRAVAAGNVGTPVLEAVLHPEPYDVLAVELSSFQLHYSHSLSALASCVLNLAPDHLDWHGSAADYAAAKARIYERTLVACVYNVQDAQTEQMVIDAEVVQGCRAIGFTTGVPGRSMVGVVDGIVADRAFVAERATSAAELGTLSDLHPSGTPAPHLVADALAAAALARAAGVPPVAVRDGMRAFIPPEHRITEVASIRGVRFVNDSKATNPHAAAASLQAYPDVVWVAGGQLKGADVEELVREAGPRLRAVVLLGVDRSLIAAALARHAPQVPVREVLAPETGTMAPSDAATTLDRVMDDVVDAALELARPGDAVLLAPAAASLDMFEDYRARGLCFSAAVQRRADREST
ncbi:MAG: UDP-N-acetylmuramoyl-L-alanine--D-glutamate ligase [Ornithinimicrobium sp.]|uniref:UDP-N-acetylmuramoyl-L-alanine--D-glutamate ligase n=1 Tax=Ornithinimicrobium sp. TaxID=1977084 RepID=UPI003D9B912D